MLHNFLLVLLFKLIMLLILLVDLYDLELILLSLLRDVGDIGIEITVGGRAFTGSNRIGYFIINEGQS